MASTPTDSPLSRAFGSWFRWSLLLILLAAELLFLSVRFDTAALSKGDNEWIRLAGDAPTGLRILLASLAAFLLIVFPRLKSIADEARRAALGHAWVGWLLLLHGLAFGAFYPATTALFKAAAAGQYPAGGALAAWAGLGGTVAALWLLAAAPLRYWLGLVSREKLALLAAAMAGGAAWGLGELTSTLWKPLAVGTFWLSQNLLGLAYKHVLFDPDDNTLGTPDFLVSIAPQCSGYEGIGLVTVFLALYLWLFRERVRFPHALLLFPLGALAIWLANAVRITALIAIGTSYSSEVALGGFHSQAGWIAFSAIALGLIALANRLRLFSRVPPAEADAIIDEQPVASALLVPMLALMGTVMLTSALTSGFDWLYPLRPIATAAALWHCRPIYRQWDWTVSWTSVAIGAAVFVVWMLMEPDSGGEVLRGGLEGLAPGQEMAWLAFRILGSVLVVPIVEELAFRGYLLRKLSGQDIDDAQHAPRFSWLALMLSSLAFGLLHGRWLAGTLAGMAYAGAFYHRGKLSDAVAAHLTTNGLIALAVLMFQQWSLWS